MGASVNGIPIQTDAVTTICNRALQRLGAQAISSLSENGKNSRECQRAYDPCRQALLRGHPWNFATAFASLPAVANPTNPPPSFNGQTPFVYNQPADFMRLVAVSLTSGSWIYYADVDYCSVNYFNVDDFMFQNGQIITWVSAPLNIRYVTDYTNAQLMDPIFKETLSAFMAQEMCEMLTQSNTKKASAQKDFNDMLAEARRINAFDKPPGKTPESRWISVRQ